MNRSNCYILYEYEYRCVFPKRLSGQIPFKQQQALHMKEKLHITCFETPHALLISILGISDTIETLTGILRLSSEVACNRMKSVYFSK